MEQTLSRLLTQQNMFFSTLTISSSRHVYEYKSMHTSICVHPSVPGLLSSAEPAFHTAALNLSSLSLVPKAVKAYRSGKPV